MVTQNAQHLTIVDLSRSPETTVANYARRKTRNTRQKYKNNNENHERKLGLFILWCRCPVLSRRLNSWNKAPVVRIP